LGLLGVSPAAAESLPPAALDLSPVASSSSPLEGLLTVPDPGLEWTEWSGDEALVAAVALGNDPDLEPRDPFRKRKMDLFSTERPVMIGRAEMVLKLRIRPSRKETMSVELHF
jgi:hypothetical protein